MYWNPVIVFDLTALLCESKSLILASNVKRNIVCGI